MERYDRDDDEPVESTKFLSGYEQRGGDFDEPDSENIVLHILVNLYFVYFGHPDLNSKVGLLDGA